MGNSKRVFTDSSSTSCSLCLMVPVLALAGYLVFTNSSWSRQPSPEYFATSLKLPANVSVQTRSMSAGTDQKERKDNEVPLSTTSNSTSKEKKTNLEVVMLQGKDDEVPFSTSSNSTSKKKKTYLEEVMEQGKDNEVPFSTVSNSTSKTKKSNLEVLEAKLGQARVAIKEAKSGDAAPDANFVPKGPMYLNATAFHRSYLEMQKRFKVFVYEEGDPPVFHFGPCKSTMAIEGYFIQAIEVSPFRTTDPDKAHVYFLPFSVTMLTHVVFVRESHEWKGMKNTALDYINVIAHKYPYWNRSLGADHFMLACHDWGPEISFAIPYLYKNSIRALCNANTSEKFNPSKDVSIPEILLPWGTTEGLLGGPPPSKRPILVFYAGGIHGPIRPILLQYWENKDKDVQVHQYLRKGISYYGMMRKSRYCICPSGYEVASPRMVEALYMGCVPVLIKDGYVIPFSDVLNWKTFSVIIPVKDIPNLKKILTDIPQRQYLRMQRRGIQVRKHFEINSPPKPYDVFHMILHSIWLRRLNLRVS